MLPEEICSLTYPGGNVSHKFPPAFDSTSNTSLRHSEDLSLGLDQTLETPAALESYDRNEAQLHEAAREENRQAEQATTHLHAYMNSDVFANRSIHLFRDLEPPENAEASNTSAAPSQRYPASGQGSPSQSRRESSTFSPLNTTGVFGRRLTVFLVRSRKLTQLRIRTAERRRKSLIHRRVLRERLHQFRITRSSHSVDDENEFQESLDLLWDRVDENESALDQDDEELAIEEEKILRLTASILTEKPQFKSAPIARDQLDIKGDDVLTEIDMIMDDDEDIDAAAQEILQVNQEECQIEDEILRLTHQQVLLMSKAFDQPESEDTVERPLNSLDELDEQRGILKERLAAVRARREQLLECAEIAPSLYEAAFPPAADIENAFEMSASQPISRQSPRGSITAITSPASDRDKTTLRNYASSDPHP